MSNLNTPESNSGNTPPPVVVEPVSFDAYNARLVGTSDVTDPHVRVSFSEDPQGRSVTTVVRTTGIYRHGRDDEHGTDRIPGSASAIIEVAGPLGLERRLVVAERVASLVFELSDGQQDQARPL